MDAGIRGLAALAALGLLGACRDSAALHSVDSDPSATPAVVDFGMVALHGRAARQVQLFNGGRAPLLVSGMRVELSSPGQALTPGSAAVPFAMQDAVALPLEVATGGSSVVHLAFVPTVAGAIGGQLHIANDSHDQPDLRVELRGLAVDAHADVTPHALDFGAIEVGASAVQALSVSNASPLPVRVTPRGILPGADEFTALPLTVQPGETLPLPVTFHPTRVGKISTALSVARCEGCEGETVTLQGEGLESALVADPDPLQFRSVPVDASADASLRLINVSSVPITVFGAALNPALDEGFRLLQPVPPTALAPGKGVTVPIRYTVTHVGPAKGALVVRSSSPRHPSLSVALLGEGGGAEVAVSPDAIDFGDVPVGGQGAAVVHVRNAGTAPELLTLEGADLAGAPVFTLEPTTLPQTLAAGAALNLHLDFVPTAVGQAQATLTVRSSDGSAPAVQVPLTGNAHAIGPCRFTLLPAAIDFGNVVPGAGAVLGFRFTNVGTEQCAVRDIHLADDAQGAFFLPGGVVRSGLLYPNDAFSVQVAFQPQAPGAVEGLLQVGVSDPAHPVIDLPLLGNSDPGCLNAVPPFIDFGAVRRDCARGPRRSHVTNVCASPVTVLSLALGAGTSDEFSLVSPIATPRVVQPGDGFNVTAAYAGQELGQNFSPLFLATSDLPHAPMLIPVLGEALQDGQTRDHFVQADGSKADVLFVVDNSNSMAEEQPRLAGAIPTFVAAAQAQGMDLHVGVLTTGIDAIPGGSCPGGAAGGEAGRLFPVDGSHPRIVDLLGPDPAGAIAQDVQVGLCHHLEQGLEAMRRGLSPPLVDHADDPLTAAPGDGNLGFLRDDAQLSVVVVSDEDDHSGDLVDDYATFLRSVKGVTQPQRVAFFGLIPEHACATSSASSAPRYTALAQATGGEIWDVCDTDFGPALSAIADRSFGNQDHFPLTAPADPATITVSVDGAALPAGSWSYDAQHNEIVFAAQDIPATGSSIDVSYAQLCP